MNKYMDAYNYIQVVHETCNCVTVFTLDVNSLIGLLVLTLTHFLKCQSHARPFYCNLHINLTSDIKVIRL